jgi:CheY-like chemotaxis protein
MRPEWQVICEVSDGSEAVQKAEELKPDLILLDISLPKLNGIEAARQIRKLSPNSKILFVSMDNSLDIVQVALGTGALGYVYKADAGSELLLAVEAVLRGERFISSGIEGSEYTGTSELKAPHRHEVQFYSDDRVLLDRLVPFVTAALKAGNVAIVVATESHRDQLVQRLKTESLDVDVAIKEGRYIPVDAVGTLSRFMVSDTPDSTQFFEFAGGLIEQGVKIGAMMGHPGIVVFGEWVSLLWNEGHGGAAIRLEQLWNQLATTYEIDLLCGYAMSSRRDEKDEHDVHRICAEHSAVYSQ